MTPTKPADQGPLGPMEVDVRIPGSWVRFISYCQTEIPHGDMKIKVVNGQPVKLLESKPDIRFDKDSAIPGIPSPSELRF